MRALVPLLAVASLCGAAAAGHARGETVYVALGAAHPLPGAAKPGDPARIAAQLRSVRPPVRLVDLTVEAATARDVRQHQLPRALALRPRLVTLAVGPAEIADDVRLASFSRELHVITDLLRRNGATVALATLPPAEWIRDAPTPAFRRRVEAFNWAIRLNAERNGARLAVIGAGVAAHPAVWQAAILSALGDPAPAERSAPRARDLAPPPEVGTAPPAPGIGAATALRAAGERLAAVRPRPGARAGRRDARG